MATAHRQASSQAQAPTGVESQPDVTWIMRVDASGPRVLDRHVARAGYDLVRGVLLFQASYASRPTRLWTARGGGQKLDLISYPDGIIMLTVEAGGEVLSYALRARLSHLLEPIIQISWDAVTGRGLLRAWSDGGDVAQQAFPIPGGVSAAVLHDGLTRPLSGALRFMALGRGALAPCASCGIMPAAWVETPDGARQVISLSVGDEIRAVDGRWAQVRAHQRVTLPCSGQLMPITLRAPYFGLTKDLTLLPHFDIIARGPSVEYLFGQPMVRLPVRALQNDHRGAYVLNSDVTEVIGLRLDRATPIVLNGAAVCVPAASAVDVPLPPRLSRQEVFTLRRFRQR